MAIFLGGGGRWEGVAYHDLAMRLHEGEQGGPALLLPLQQQATWNGKQAHSFPRKRNTIQDTCIVALLQSGVQQCRRWAASLSYQRR